MGLNPTDADAITVEILREFVIRDDTGTASTVADWASCSKSEADHRLSNVLEPAGLVSVVGTKEQPDPLQDAHVWDITEDGIDWTVANIEDILGKLLDERPGELVIQLLDRTEGVEQHMESVRGEFESIKEDVESVADEVEDLREQQPDGELLGRVERVEAEVSELGSQLDNVERMARTLAEDMDALERRVEQVIGEQY